MYINRMSIVKFLELALTCTCVGLHYQSYNVEPEIGMLVTGTFVGFLIILSGVASGYLMQSPTHKRLDMFYSLVGVCLFLASGGVVIDKYQDQSKSEIGKYNLAKGSLAIINAAVLLIDSVLTQRGE
ncbi:uncharacterized protein LOC135075010 [Ostrinia nubilalis]|uniref:uncharacterized protein LOC114352589 n=1 Tax=Ostrinia furnacalis TaxID=93504 RepID=UPI00103D65AB|nr:uncharacterized protein LOC114352589 [Ostrinia furnacalis]